MNHQLFVIPLDEQGKWHRYHPLFADLLWHYLKNKHSEGISSLHESAARWSLEAGDPGEAVRHSLRGERRKTEVLHLLSQGLSNQEIAEKLFLSEGTVKWHNSNIYGKMGVKSRTEAVARARRLGLLE